MKKYDIMLSKKLSKYLFFDLVKQANKTTFTDEEILRPDIPPDITS